MTTTPAPRVAVLFATAQGSTRDIAEFICDDLNRAVRAPRCTTSSTHTAKLGWAPNVAAGARGGRTTPRSLWRCCSSMRSSCPDGLAGPRRCDTAHSCRERTSIQSPVLSCSRWRRVWCVRLGWDQAPRRRTLIRRAHRTRAGNVCFTRGFVQARARALSRASARSRCSSNLGIFCCSRSSRKPARCSLACSPRAVKSLRSKMRHCRRTGFKTSSRC